MEEKERYGCRYIRGEFDVFIDNETDKYLTIQEVKHLLNQQDKRIKELEEELRIIQYYKTETNKLDYELRKENQQLKQQLKESEKKREYLFSSNCDYVSQIKELDQKLEESKSEIEKQKQKYDNLYKCYQKTSSDDLQDKYHLAEEIDQLKQQLAEKDENIESYKHTIYMNMLNQEMLELKVATQDQDKISFCIEQLEKVDEFIKGSHCFDFGDVRIKIEQQINELKGNVE